MRKKAKSFAVEEDQYNDLFDLFKENYVEISISYCINRYIKEFLEYLKQVEKTLHKDASFTVPMAFVIEAMAREPVFRKFDSDSAIRDEVEVLQEKYNIYIKKNPEKAGELDATTLSDELEFTKTVRWLAKVALFEVKMGREPTPDELQDIGVQVGGKQFLKAFRVKMGPIAQRLAKYDPDLNDVYSRIVSRLFKNDDGR